MSTVVESPFPRPFACCCFPVDMLAWSLIYLFVLLLLFLSCCCER